MCTQLATDTTSYSIELWCVKSLLEKGYRGKCCMSTKVEFSKRQLPSTELADCVTFILVYAIDCMSMHDIMPEAR